MRKLIRIGTRESKLAIWQATHVQQALARLQYPSELVLIKSEGDIDLHTPLYEMGVQGIFTKSLDMALLSGKIDIAVHSMKDVPTRLAVGIEQAAVLKRASHQDLLFFKKDSAPGFDWNYFKALDPAISLPALPLIIATSSMRRRAQWLHHFPNHQLEVLRGNVNTRLAKLEANNWHGAIFAAAGLERINLRPANSVDLDWMLPAPAQGAIVVVCRREDTECLNACAPLNDSETALCVKTERDFLRTLMGGCSTPVGALATIQQGKLLFRGNLLSPDGMQQLEVTREADLFSAGEIGITAAKELLDQGGKTIIDGINAKG